MKARKRLLEDMGLKIFHLEVKPAEDAPSFKSSLLRHQGSTDFTTSNKLHHPPDLLLVVHNMACTIHSFDHVR